MGLAGVVTEHTREWDKNCYVSLLPSVKMVTALLTYKTPVFEQPPQKASIESELLPKLFETIIRSYGSSREIPHENTCLSLSYIFKVEQRTKQSLSAVLSTEMRREHPCEFPNLRILNKIQALDTVLGD